MLNKPVKINGSIFTDHRIASVTQDFESNKTTIQVISTNETERYITYVARPLMDISEGITMDELYDYINRLPEFELYVSDGDAKFEELVSLLNDEQVETLPMDYFAMWTNGYYYTVGSRVRYNDNLYKCVQAHTSQFDWTPDVATSLWILSREGTAGEPIEWIQPTGAHDAYNRGDRVIHNGDIWKSRINGNVWEPGTVGTDSLWEFLGHVDDDDDDENPDEPVTPDIPDEPVEPDVPSYYEWVQPTGATDAYAQGDIVIHNGSTWRSLINGNVWEPGSVGAESLWEIFAE